MNDYEKLLYKCNRQKNQLRKQKIKIVEYKEEIEKLKNRIHALEKHNQRLQLEAQKYFDLLMECEYGDKGESNE